MLAQAQIQPQPHRFSVDDYYRMAETGILAPDAPVELIAGEVVEMSPSGSRHAACIRRLNQLLAQSLGGRAQLSIQSPIRLGDDSEPEPDLVLLAPRDDFYAKAHPGPGDILLLIEVSETSLPFDQGVKVPLYARHGIAEVWLVDLGASHLSVYRSPHATGYAQCEHHATGRLAPLALPGVELSLDGFFG